MVRDKLQEKLKELEKRNPSINKHNQSLGKTLSDRLFFLERARKGVIEEIPKKEMIYAPGSLDQQVMYFNKLVKYQRFGDEANSWLFSLVEHHAIEGCAKREIDSHLKYAKQEARKINVEIDSEIVDLAYKIWERGIVENGRSAIEKNLEYAKEMARNADGWWAYILGSIWIRDPIEISKKLGIDISDRINEIKQIYFSEAIRHAPEKIRWWINETKERLRKHEYPETSFRIAKLYADDAGLKFDYKLEYESIPFCYQGKVFQEVE